MAAGKIVVLGTGGTIAGAAASAHDSLRYTAAQIGVAQLLADIPALAQTTLESEQVAQVDSKDLAHATWRTLALRCAHWLAREDVQGLVVTHGTDTLEETAWFLHRVLAPRKPVVLTCAMRPATSLAPDGPQNIVDAITVATTPGARGVTAVCAGVVHDPADVAKVHPLRLDAFGSGDAGPLAHVEGDGLRQLRAWPDGDAPAAAALLGRVEAAARWPWVEIVTSHAGADGRVVDALVAQGVDGLVAACTGNGTLHEALEAALLRAQAQGVRVVRATRVALGRIVAAPDDAFRASAVSPVKARIDLLLDLLA